VPQVKIEALTQFLHKKHTIFSSGTMFAAYNIYCEYNLIISQ